MAKSYRNHFKKTVPGQVDSDTSFYIKKWFEFTAHCNSKYASSEVNMLARLQNTLATALNQKVVKEGTLPKYILIILDDDLITYLDFAGEGVATLLGSYVEWLSEQFQKLIKDRCSNLPAKCKTVPFFYWVAAPTHAYFSKDRNRLRVKFNLGLESVMRSKNYDNMRVIKIKEVWNTRDSSLVINDRMTEHGLSVYWRAVDATFQYNETRREIFVAKKVSTVPVEPPQKKVVDLSHDKDPMRSFFRRNQDREYVEHRRDAREDRRDNGRRFDRFLLPRARTNFRY